MTNSITYFWTMDQLEMYHESKYNGYFFNKETIRWWKSRVQTIPPYGGRVFVTSEKMDFRTPRKYSVREIKPDGSISTVGEFCKWNSRKEAHNFANKYSKKYKRQDTLSIQIGE